MCAKEQNERRLVRSGFLFPWRLLRLSVTDNLSGNNESLMCFECLRCRNHRNKIQGVKCIILFGSAAYGIQRSLICERSVFVTRWLKKPRINSCGRSAAKK